MKIKALGDSVLFQFLSESRNGMFVPKLSQTIMIAGAGIDHQDGPRWGKVVFVGPEVDSEIQVGKFILIDALKWTPGVDIGDNQKIWKTASEHVLAVSDVEVNPF